MKKKFIWSTSTNSFQIEGGRNLLGRSDSIWDEFTKRNFVIPPTGVAKREINSIEIAADFYHKYKTDANIMSRAGINGFVYNLDWTRLFPKNATDVSAAGLQWLDDIFKTFKEKNIIFIPILFHWDYPMWAQIQGGWENRKIIDWFRNYVSTIFKYFGKYTDYWFVNDENSTFTLDGYLKDYLPPQRNNKEAWVKAVHHLNLSAAVAKEEFLKAKKMNYVNEDAILGIDHDWSPPIPYRKDNIEDLAACEKYNSWFKNLWLDPNMKGFYPEVFYSFIKENNINFEITKKDLSFLKQYTLDFIGWNYYRPCYIASDNLKEPESNFQIEHSSFPFKSFMQVYPKNNVNYTKWNWIIDSSKLIPGARELAKDYGKQIPLMIIENGMGAFDDKTGELIIDDYRINYLQEHIEKIMLARKEGINFIGYSLWTYCDIYSPSGGYRKDYGLISVDFNSPIRERKPKLSYEWYKQVIASDGEDLSIDLEGLKKSLKKDLDNWDWTLK